MNALLARQLTAQDNADQAPTEAMLAGYDAACRDLRTAVASWVAINATELTGLNSVLSKQGLKPLVAAGVKAPACAEKATR